jgi:uncharacterized Ntn-hydrolase superfamily protein
MPMTFSIVARCAETGRLGVAVATASVAVGARCPFAMSGVGAVVTQNRTNPLIGPRALALLGAGAKGDDAARQAAESFGFPEWRQVAIVDGTGAIGTFHGARCSGVHAEARGAGVAALGNLLQSPEVPAAMVDGYAVVQGGLEDRLLAALDAGLAAGGEIKPLRSAALLVVDRDPFPYTDLRVDYDTAPLAALRTLWVQWRPMADTCRTWALDPYGV